MWKSSNKKNHVRNTWRQRVSAEHKAWETEVTLSREDNDRLTSGSHYKIIHTPYCSHSHIWHAACASTHTQTPTHTHTHTARQTHTQHVRLPTLTAVRYVRLFPFLFSDWALTYKLILHAHSPALPFSLSHTHTYTHTYTHIYTHTHTHTQFVSSHKVNKPKLTQGHTHMLDL